MHLYDFQPWTPLAITIERGGKVESTILNSFMCDLWNVIPAGPTAGRFVAALIQLTSKKLRLDYRLFRKDS